MGYQVELSDRAVEDLGEIVRFLADKSPEAADRIGHELLNTALTLTFFPSRGAAVRRRPGIRKLAHRHFLIFYQINEASKIVEVVRICDGRRNPADLNLGSP
jgi:toxin ParE1/3/4